jgi:predicted AAA+ superfamily ATPase
MEIIRKIIPKLELYASQLRSVAVMGVRQSGKTTVCKKLFGDKEYVNFEDLNTFQKANSDPLTFLNHYKNGAVFDEIQRLPLLFNYLQGILDVQKEKGKFILTGSSNFKLNDTITQSLAGRIGYIEMYPLSYNEIPNYKSISITEHILKGGFPEIWSEKMSPLIFYPNYLQSVIEKDIRQLVNIKDINLFQQFLKLLATRIGQELNYLKIGQEIGIDSKTCQAWMSYLQIAGVLFLLPPYHKNFGKRITKKAKLYFIDTGIVSNLLGIVNEDYLENHPLKGEIFENFVIANCVKLNSYLIAPKQLFFWRSQAGVEVDLIIEDSGKLLPIEIKSGRTFHSNWWKNCNLFEKYAQTNQDPIIIYNGDDYAFADGKKLLNIYDLENLFVEEHHLLV